MPVPDEGITYAVARDITERKQAEVEQVRLQRELQQALKMEAIGRLTGGIAHNLNNILGIILGNTELALKYCIHDDQTKQRTHLKGIEKLSREPKGWYRKF